MALLLLAAQWRETAAPPIAVATVDHGLRAEAAVEARQVGEWARARGFTHHILTHSGAPPRTRVQERARALRYDLLRDCAEKTGADTIVTAHHADDQAETILFRLTRGSGVAGLAGMAEMSRLGALRLFRPLLGVPKADLIALCENHAQPFITDPSNLNESFARPRLRRLGPQLAALGLDREALLRLGMRAARAEAALGAVAAQASQDIGWRDIGWLDGGTDVSALASMPEEIALRILAGIIAAAGGGAVRLERVESLCEALLTALRARAPVSSTLAGLLVRLTADGALTLTREGVRRRGRALSAG